MHCKNRAHLFYSLLSQSELSSLLILCFLILNTIKRKEYSISDFLQPATLILLYSLFIHLSFPHVSVYLNLFLLIWDYMLPVKDRSLCVLWGSLVCVHLYPNTGLPSIEPNSLSMLPFYNDTPHTWSTLTHFCYRILTPSQNLDELIHICVG